MAEQTTQPHTIDDVMKELTEIRHDLRRIRRGGFATAIGFFGSFALAGVFLVIQSVYTSYSVFYGCFLFVIGITWAVYYRVKQKRI